MLLPWRRERARKVKPERCRPDWDPWILLCSGLTSQEPENASFIT